MPVVSPVCEGTPVFALTGVNPAGGVYSGNGISGNNFDPAMAGTGTHVITYAFTDANGCSNTGNMNITVNALPNVTLSSFSSVCQDAAPIALSGGSPAGGSYSGTGVIAGLFDPFLAGAGVHAIQYAYTDANGCSNSDVGNLTVNALPVVALSALNPVCIASAAFQLTAGSPSGGTYSGPGVSAGVFDPAVAGLGNHSIRYSYTDPNGCSGEDSTTLTVYDLPVVTLATFGASCIDAAPIQLSGGFPAGGVYSGPGVVNNIFNPALAGTGNKTIFYSYTDANGCSNSDTAGLLVNPLPVVSLNLNLQLCEHDSTLLLTGGTPAGGVYTGNNIIGGNFYPQPAGPGVHQVIYFYTDANGCTGYDTSALTVNPMIYLHAGPDDTICTGYMLQLNGTGASGLYWSPAAGLSCTACPDPVASPVVLSTYILSSSAACSVPDTLTIQVIPAVSVQAGPDTVLCYGSSIQLSAAANAPVISWAPPSSLSCEDCPDPVATPQAPVSYIVTVTNGSCTAADTIFIRVIHPEADAGPDHEILLGESVQLNASGCSQYSWSPGQLLNDSLSSSPVATPEITTVFTVLGVLEGCQDSDTIVVHVIDIGDALFVPNAFTPNKDGRNDFFGPVRQGQVNDFEMVIFNRWGQRVFESTSITKWWDGTFGGQLQPEGTYIYIIRMRISGHPLMKTGRVSLIR